MMSAHETKFARVGLLAEAGRVRVTGFYGDNCNFPFSVRSDDAVIDHAIIRQDTEGDRSPLYSGGRITFRNCVFYYGAGMIFKPMFLWTGELDGATVAFENCLFHVAENRNIMDATSNPWSSGTLKVNNCIFASPGAGAFQLVVVPDGVDYQGDHNVFLAEAANNLDLNHHGTLYDALPAWQAATGQDANSIALGQTDFAGLFSGVIADGDFRLAESDAGAQAPALVAGPQSHWDWNARRPLSGPPSAWPQAPRTLAEAGAYCGNPDAWVF